MRTFVPKLLFCPKHLLRLRCGVAEPEAPKRRKPEFLQFGLKGQDNGVAKDLDFRLRFEASWKEVDLNEA